MMRTFKVRVRLENGSEREYTELAVHSFDCNMNAVDRFGPCKVSVVPA